MNKRSSIQVKAAFLMIVFSLNTIIGFACAVGMDMGFNTHHHDEEEKEITTHIHSGGIKHEHHNETGKHHDEAGNHKEKGKDDCCHDKVIKIIQVDKAVPQSLSAINPVFFTIFISSFYNIDLLYNSRTTSIKYFVRSHHPPIPDIRLAIQSFQI
ncbi:MAG: hypothetical protein H0W12_01290 [Chitinophagaceae bacterium]|nr:hypothetical protein [Chitinophagaceae bacterium]